MIKNIKITLFLVYLPFLIFLLFFLFFMKSGFEYFSLIFLFLILLISTMAFTVKGENYAEIQGQYLKHSTIFLIGYFIVHFQFYLDLILGYETLNNNFVVVNENIIIKCMVISLIGLICFYIGYSISVLIKRVEKEYYSLASTMFLDLISIVILIYYYISVNPLYLTGGYNIYEMGAQAKYAALAYTAFVYAIIIQRTMNLLSKKTNIFNLLDFLKNIGFITLFGVFVYLIGVILSGDRGPIMSFSLLYLASYLILTKIKLKKIKILLIIICAGSVFSVLGQARKNIMEDSFIDKLQFAIFNTEDNVKKSIVSATKELSLSVNSMHQLVNYIPAHHDYLYGKLQYNEFLLSLPLGGIIFNYNESPQTRKFVNIQNYTTWIAQGDYPSYGNGTTIISDLYSIFGVVSIIFFMFCFGWFVRFLEVKMFVTGSQNIFILSLVVIYFCEMLYLSRSSFLGVFKIIFLVFIILLLNGIFFSKRKV